MSTPLEVNIGFPPDYRQGEVINDAETRPIDADELEIQLGRQLNAEGTDVAGLGKIGKKAIDWLWKAGEDNPIKRKLDTEGRQRTTPEEEEAMREGIDALEVDIGPVPGQPDPGGPAGRQRPGTAPWTSGGINARHIIGEDYPGDPDELKRMIDQAATDPVTAPEVRTWASIDERLSDAEYRVRELKKAVDINTRGGVWNDQQMIVASDLYATWANDLVELNRAIQAKGGAAQADKDLVLAFTQKSDALRGLQATLRGQRTEAARALASARHKGQALETGTVAEFMNQAAVTEAQGKTKASSSFEAMYGQIDMFDNMMRGTNNISLTDIANYARRGPIGRTVDALTYMRKSALLYGLGTQSVNVASNFVTAAYESLLVNPMAALVGTVRRQVLGDTTGMTFDQAAAEARGVATSIPNAMQMGIRAWVRRDSSFGDQTKAELNNVSPLSVTALGDSLMTRGIEKADDYFVSLTFRLLAAGDDFFKSLAYEGTTWAEAWRIAQAQGGTKEEIQERFTKLIDTPTEAMHEAAMKEAHRRTYTNDPEGLLGGMADMVTKLKNNGNSGTRLLFETFMPFVRTPTNLVNYGIDNSLLAPLTDRFGADIAAGGIRADKAIAKMVLGTALSGTMIYMATDGLITGGGPADYQARLILEATGWRPYSIKVGDEYHDMARLFGQFAVPFMLAADLHDKFAYATTDSMSQNVGAAFIASMAGLFDNIPMLQGMDEIFRMLNQGKIDPKFVGRTAATYVPVPNFLYEMNRWGDQDELERIHSRDAVAYVSKRLSGAVRSPFWMGWEQPTPARYWDGSPKIVEGGRIVRMTGLFRTSTLKDDLASRTLVRFNVIPTPPDRMVKINGFGFNMLDMDNQRGIIYDKYLDLVGKERREAIEDKMDTRDYRRADDTTKALMLKDMVSRGAGKGKQAWLKWLNDEGYEFVSPEYASAVLGISSERGRKRFFKQLREDVRGLTPREARKARPDVGFMETGPGMNQPAQRLIPPQPSGARPFTW